MELSCHKKVGAREEQQETKIAVCLPGELTTNNFQYIEFSLGRRKTSVPTVENVGEFSFLIFNDS